MAKKRVYVSSTFIDLQEHRKTVKATLERAGFDVECMEKYPAFDERPVKKCLADVAECDYYVLVLAWRYGHQPKTDNPNSLSITHMEYEEAVRREKPCLAFLLDPDEPWIRSLQDVDSQLPESAICQFRAHIQAEHGRALFGSPDSLARAIHEALRAEEQKHLTAAEKAQAQIRDDYLSWLRTTCESVELLGLTLKESHNLRLGQVYVPAVTASRAELQDQQSSKFGDPYELLLGRLDGKSFYVPGAPGSGKSTFCRWLSYLAAGGKSSDHLIETPDAYREILFDSLAGRFPLLCNLREWAGSTKRLRGSGRWYRSRFEESLVDWVDDDLPGGLTGAVLRKELATGQCLIILDGLDEIPESLPDGALPRRNFITGLADTLPAWLSRGHQILLTSRPYGLSGEDRRLLGLPVAELADLPDELQKLFVRRWYAAADPSKAKEKAEGLLRHLDEREELRDFRHNPMLLTALCILWDQGQKLPQDFYRLHEAVVGQVLYKRYLTENERDQARYRLEAVASGMHKGFAAERGSPAAEVSLDEIDGHLAAYARIDLVTESGALSCAERREELLSNSGLLLPKNGGRAAFYHLSFQEFLAADYIRRTREPIAALLERHALEPTWRRTLRFLFCAIADKDSPRAAITSFESLTACLHPQALDADPNPALLLCDCLEVAHGRGWSLECYAELLRRACKHALEHLPPPPRAHLWRILGRLGLDDRPGVGLLDGLPDIHWVEVPAGPFLYGEEQEIRHLPVFHIARYPVTNAQYQAFLADDGYGADEWWEGLVKRPEPGRGFWSESNHPRETVSWYEAMAYARWLNTRLRERGLLPEGWTVRLPTEEEWEKAARGENGREFPWGDYVSGRANHDETWNNHGPHYLHHTTAVGIYPLGASPFGCLDLAGNIWEWCLNLYERPGCLALSGDARRAVRGGSWHYSRNHVRCTCRYGSAPDDHDSALGFRLICVSS